MEAASDAPLPERFPQPQPSNAKKVRHGPTDLERILEIGRETMRRTKKNGDDDANGTSLTEDRRFREMFGCGLLVAHALWTRLNDDASLESRSIEDMMRALIFLKSYGKEGTISVMVGTIDEKTYRKRLWPMIEAIGALESVVVRSLPCLTLWCFLSPSAVSNNHAVVGACHFAFLQINWDKRITGDLGNDCLVSVDGTDFRIQQGYGIDFYLTSLGVLDFVMKLRFAFSRAILFGSMGPTNAVCGMTS